MENTMNTMETWLTTAENHKTRKTGKKHRTKMKTIEPPMKAMENEHHGKINDKCK